MRAIADLMAEAGAFAGLTDAQRAVLAACGRTARFPAGAPLFREGEPADRFYLLRSGTIALEMAVPGREPLVIETLHAGDVVGWSWLFEPYRWQFDALVSEPVAAVVFDGVCLRGKCDADHELGYQLMRRFAGTLVTRLQATRRQLQDVYGHVAA